MTSFWEAISSQIEWHSVKLCGTGWNRMGHFKGTIQVTIDSLQLVYG